MTSSSRPFSIVPYKKQKQKQQEQQLLSSCTICLTGFTDRTEKQQLIALISKYGGIYTPNLQFEQLPSHIIVKTYEQQNQVLYYDSTDKLEFVLEYNKESSTRSSSEEYEDDDRKRIIHVVSAEWLLACANSKRLVPEMVYNPITAVSQKNCGSMNNLELENDSSSTLESQSSSQELFLSISSNGNGNTGKHKIDLMQLPLHEAYDLVIQHHKSISSMSCVFAQCQFYILTSKGAGDTHSSPLARCIRMGLGTNCWEVHERITHFVVALEDGNNNVSEKVLR